MGCSSAVWSLAAIVCAAAPIAAQWKVIRHTDEMTDAKMTLFEIQAAVATLGVARQPVRASLLLRCSGSVLRDAYLAHQAYTPDGHIWLRFDRDSAYADEWNLSTSDEALFSPDPEALLDSILLHRTVRIRYTPHREPPQTATFAIGGLAPVATAFAHACGVDPTGRARALRRAVAVIELAVPDTIRTALPGPLALRPLIRGVRDRTGRPVTTYTVGARVTRPAERLTVMVVGDTIELDSGESEVLLEVDGVPAPYAMRFRVPAGDSERVASDVAP